MALTNAQAPGDATLAARLINAVTPRRPFNACQTCFSQPTAPPARYSALPRRPCAAVPGRGVGLRGRHCGVRQQRDQVRERAPQRITTVLRESGLASSSIRMAPLSSTDGVTGRIA